MSGPKYPNGEKVWVSYYNADMLGHYNVSFTLRTYTHATRQMQDQAAETTGSFMAQVM